MIDQDVSGKLVEVVEKWQEYVSIDGESERYILEVERHRKMYASRALRYEARHSTNY